MKKTTELEALKSKLHKTEERIRRGKRKVGSFYLFLIIARLTAMIAIIRFSNTNRLF